MGQQIMLPSFASGEWSPAMYARVDLGKYHTAAALLRNMVVDYHGGAYSRAGTQFVGVAGTGSNPTRLVPFTFSSGQTYVLIFGNFTMSVAQNGGMVLNTAVAITAISNTAPATITAPAHGYTNGQEVFIGTAPGMPAIVGGPFLVGNVTTNTFTITDIYGVNVDSTLFGTLTAIGTVASVFSTASPYAATDLALLKFAQSADTVFFTHTSYQPYTLQRVTNTNWTFALFAVAPAVATPNIIGFSITASSAGTTTYSYVVTAVSSLGHESLPSQCATINTSAPMSTTIGAYITLAFPSGIAFWTGTEQPAYYKIYRTPEVPSASPLFGAAYGYVGQVQFVPSKPGGGQHPITVFTTLSFVDHNIAPDFTQQPPAPNNPFNVNQTQAIAIVYPGAGYNVGDIVTFGPIGSGYPAVAQVTTVGGGGSVTALTQISPGFDNGFVANGTVYAIAGFPCSGTGLSATYTLIAGTATYPSCCAFYQQRLAFGGFSGNATEMFMSKTGDYYNFSQSQISQANDAIQFSILSTKVNQIEHIVPMTSMVVLSSSGAWRVDSGQLYGPITPTSILAAPQAYSGASNVAPIVINYDIIYVQARGSSVRDLSYNFYVNTYTGNDISALSNHLLFPHTIKEWTWAEEPYKTIWAVRDDGIALSLTYLKEQEVLGWAHSDTPNGDFLSVCSVPEGNIDAVYFIVGRWINGQYTQFVERMSSRILGTDKANNYPGDPSKAWCVDCGVNYAPTPGDCNLFPFGTTGTFLINFDSNTSPASQLVVPGAILRFNGGWFTVVSRNTAIPNVALQAEVTTIIASVSQEVSPAFDWTVGTNAKTILGAWNLNRVPVTVLADGSPVTGLTVTNGQITLPNQASDVKIGIGYQVQFQSLPVNPPAQGAETSQGKRTKVSAVTVRMQDSRGMKVGPNFGALLQFKERSFNTGMGLPLPLTTGDERILVEEDWTTFNQVCIQQDDPLPMTVLGVFPEIQVGDTA